MKSFDEYAAQIDEMLPQTAYVFVYEKMPEEVVKAIENGFAAGMTPEFIADMMAERYSEITPAKKKFFIKALEHHKFLYAVKNDLL